MTGITFAQKLAMASAARPCVDRGNAWPLGITLPESVIFGHATTGNGYRNVTKRTTRRLGRLLT